MGDLACSASFILPCFNKSTCDWYKKEEDISKSYIVSSCWTLLLIFFCCGVLFLLLSLYLAEIETILIDFYNKIKRCRSRKLETHEDNSDEEESERFYADSCTLQDIPGFILTNRTEENFIRNNTCTQLTLPYPYAAEYSPTYDYKIRFLSGEMSAILPLETYGRHLITIFCFSFGWGCIGTAFSIFLQLRIKYELECGSVYFNLRDTIDDISSSFKTILDDYKFLPIFLIVGYIGFVADRWRDWLINCHRLQGKFHDFGLLCGCAVTGPVDIVVRKHLYKIYRYLNCIHAVTYQSVSFELDRMSIENEFIQELNLLTEEEVENLIPMDNKIRDTLVSWLGIEAVAFLKHDSVADNIVSVGLMESLRSIRAVAGKHHDLFVQDRSNAFTKCLNFFTSTYILLVIMSYPFILSIIKEIRVYIQW